MADRDQPLLIRAAALAAATTILAATLLSGCGDTAAPTQNSAPAAKRISLPTVEAKLATQSVSTAVADADYAVAIGAPQVRSVTAEVGVAGGELLVRDSGARPQEELEVSFHVPPGALTVTRTITMRVIGDHLSNLVVDFDPGGLTFSPWATLALTLGSERVDVEPETLQAVHIRDDGDLEVVGTELFHVGAAKTYQFWVDVPGFSRYGLR